ncbi:MAG: T9SS type A sorting domain-containing protein [Ignavibacteria bacterium]|nr:T9SS type A sorting domain-containing protein [Ignavibacteria bacterium]
MTSSGGGVFRTTNGGVNWIQQAPAGDYPNKIYMYNSRIGFIGFNAGTPTTKKTTDGGFNWFTVSNEGFTDIHFVDSLTGWKCNVFTIKKTSNGGINWISQSFPTGKNILNGIRRFSILNKDTIWGVGGIKQLGIVNRGMIYRTTNGGNYWLYQVPDTSINIPRYEYSNFVSALKGWSYGVLSGVHTLTGGDSTFYPMVNINQISIEVPIDFKLNQNYPNPFNPTTTISFKIKNSEVVKIKVYNIEGREISIPVNEKLNPGEYQFLFDAGTLSSGVYFYSLIIDEEIMDTKKMILVR